MRDFAEKTRADLIALGKHGHSAFEELIVGSVTRDTLERTRCDLLVAPRRVVDRA